MTSPVSLEQIYKDVLETGWLICDEQGNVYRNLASVSDDKKEPFILLDKQVALPTRENLNRSGKDNLLIFHPLMEGVVGGESPVIGKLRRAYSIRFTYAASSIFSNLLTGAQHTTEYSKFSPSQMRLFKALNKVDEKTVKVWEKLVKLSHEIHGASNSFADVYTTRNALVDGKSYSRVASVRFPIYDELAKNSDKVFGSNVVMSKGIRQNLMQLFEFMIPNIAVKDAYTVGTNSRIAPYLDALLKTFGQLFQITNDLYDEFNNVIPMEESIHTPINWREITTDIESLKNLAQSVPQQYGNYPIKVEDEKRQNTGSVVNNQSLNKQTAPIPTVSATQTNISTPQISTPQQVIQPNIVENNISNNVVIENNNDTGFSGIGVPIEGANGVVNSKPHDLRAIIIDNSQSRVMVDPQRAAINAVVEIARNGGVGRVSANQVNTAVINNNNSNFDNVFNNNNNNNNGWNTNNNNGWNTNNGPVVSDALRVRELAIQRIKSEVSPFSSSGGLLNRGTVI